MRHICTTGFSSRPKTNGLGKPSEPSNSERTESRAVCACQLYIINSLAKLDRLASESYLLLLARSLAKLPLPSGIVVSRPSVSSWLADWLRCSPSCCAWLPARQAKSWLACQRLEPTRPAPEPRAGNRAVHLAVGLRGYLPIRLRNCHRSSSIFPIQEA